MFRTVTHISVIAVMSLCISACLPETPSTPAPPAEPEPPAPMAGDARDCSSYIVPYMPYSIATTQTLYAANVPNAWTGESNTPSTDISVDVIDEKGTSIALGQLATAGPQQIVVLTTLIQQALDAQGITSTKLALRIQASNPENLYVYSAYLVGGSDRAFVQVECIKN